jgi:hypothetical protein
MLANPISRLNVVRVSILRKPCGFSLLRREKTLLSFRYLVEALGCFFPHFTILQLI